MTKITPARKAALNMMRAIRSGELADRAFVRLADEVPERDRAWLHELSYGTLRMRGRLDHILRTFIKRGFEKLDADVLDILRLGAYQILEMHSVPAYAAVSQAVELTKTTRSKSASGFVNGVLQTVRREQKDLVPEPRAWSSHPDWLLDRWIARFGLTEALALADSNNRRPELYIRPLGMSPGQAQQKLSARNIESHLVEAAPNALRIEPPASVADVLATVTAIVQDPAAGLVVDFADLHGVVADVCAAPGGKAIALADRMRDGRVVAGDVSASRIARVSENVRRLDHLPIDVIVADARKPPFDQVDGVLLDAPCTGTGTFRRHPDGKWRVQKKDLKGLMKLQRQLLDAAAQVVRPGGILVYSTCSLEPEENEEQITAFMSRHEDSYRLLGTMEILPQQHGFDGAFAARLERTK